MSRDIEDPAEILKLLRNVSHEDLDDFYAHQPCDDCGLPMKYDRNYPRETRPLFCLPCREKWMATVASENDDLRESLRLEREAHEKLKVECKSVLEGAGFELTRFYESKLQAEREAREKAEAFKAYIHKRLDEAGVPVDPPSVHRDVGCRIGGRLDVLFAAHEATKRELVEVKHSTTSICDDYDDVIKRRDIALDTQRQRAERLEGALRDLRTAQRAYMAVRHADKTVREAAGKLVADMADAADEALATPTEAKAPDTENP